MSRYYNNYNNKNNGRNYNRYSSKKSSSIFLKAIISIMLLAVLAFGGYYMYTNYNAKVTVPPVVNIEDENDDIVLPGLGVFSNPAPVDYNFVSADELVNQSFDLTISADEATVTVLRDDIVVHAGEDVLFAGDILEIIVQPYPVCTIDYIRVNGADYTGPTLTVTENILIEVRAIIGGGPFSVDGTPGLEYELSELTGTYKCVGWGTAFTETDIIIPDTYQGVPVLAFDSSFDFFLDGVSPSVVNLTLPRYLQYSGGLPALKFSSCKFLENIFISVDNGYFKSIDGVLYDKNLGSLLVYPSNNPRTDFTVLSSVMTISTEVFRNSRNLENIFVEEGIYGYSSFDGVLYRTSVNTTLLKYPSARQDEVYVIDISCSIGNGSFTGCNLKELHITVDSVVSLNGDINMVFGDLSDDFIIRVPLNKLEQYKSFNHWSEIADRIFALED